MVQCPKCGSDAIKFGFKKGIQRFQCKKCKHVFLQKSASSLGLDISLREEAVSKPQPQNFESNPQGEYEQPEPEQKPEKPLEPQKLRTTTEVISDGFGNLIGNLIGDILNEAFFKDKKEKPKQQEGIDYI